MSRRRPVRSEVWESEPVWTRARLLREGDGLPMAVSDATDWRLSVYDLADFGLVYSISDQAPSDGALFNTLQTTGWDGDGPGYNFAHSVQPSDVGLLGGRSYRLEYVVATSTEGNLVVVHETHVLGLFGT